MVCVARHWDIATENATLADPIGRCTYCASCFFDDIFDNGQSEAYPFTVLLRSSLQLSKASEKHWNVFRLEAHSSVTNSHY